ncbi:MAG: Re/Si-specific NAD(P)(+) transhydrogenase subunit alpha [Acidobacteriota bacterium]|nr:Re/Si-specific NAD(P)(+) transhydrogenase subunit alpha [Acidobacteriota bacterium]MDH3523521.1 Re/Si-specific NAD(P)(+) transhydrogenase subunit alpha [Acidobacteriota bacterium]
MTETFVPKERRAHEHRVAATPETVEKLCALGLTALVERGAGAGAHIPDAAYEAAGAQIVDGGAATWERAAVVLKVAAPAVREDGVDELDLLAPESLLIGLLAPYADLDRVERLARRGVTSLAMELLPRITRAQSMDALSSQANVAGYKAVILAAERLARYFPMLMTAAGTIRPARVVVIGGGVAGLQALATAKRLGAIVEVSDIRPDVKEQVESLGGRFIELPEMESGEGEGGYARAVGEDFLTRQRAILTEHLKSADAVITTAQVPGKKAPVLLAREMIAAMKPGAVVVDLAAEQGGNCALTRAGEEVEEGGVRILGPINLAATVALDASNMYARNVLHVVEHLMGESGPTLDLEDEITAGALLTHGGEVRHPRVLEQLAAERRAKGVPAS